MAYTRIKICGIMRPQDALAAAHAGADAIGIVFHPAAKRYVAPESAKQIIAALPPFVTPVGLFVDAPVDSICALAYLLGLRQVQLHGHEDAHCVRGLERFAIIKAIRVDPQTFSAELSRWRDAIRQGLPNLRGIVLETATSAPGGSGQANDWTTIAHARANGEFNGLPPIIAAGGLTPANVAAVVREIRPWAVDVSSGVEEQHGSKSVKLIEQFVAAVRSADA